MELTDLAYVGDDCDMQFGTTTSSNTVWPPAEDILATILKAKEELDAPPLIKVWIGDGFETKTDYPTIYESPYLTEDTCYIMAGVGVIAGKKAYKRIWELGYIAVWDENPQSYDDPLHRN